MKGGWENCFKTSESLVVPSIVQGSGKKVGMKNKKQALHRLVSENTNCFCLCQMTIFFLVQDAVFIPVVNIFIEHGIIFSLKL